MLQVLFDEGDIMQLGTSNAQRRYAIKAHAQYMGKTVVHDISFVFT